MNEINFFIIGMPRSGTKLLRELLNNHPSVFIPDAETLFIPHLLEKYGQRKLTPREIKEVLDEIEKSLFFYFFSQHRNLNFQLFDPEEVTIVELLNNFFVFFTNQISPDATLLGDKSPNYIEKMELLLEFFPDVKFIHIVRDPRDFALSSRNAWNKNIFRAAFRWSQALNKIQKLSNKQKLSLVEVKYEDLLLQPEKTLKEICSFLKVPYDDSLITLEKPVEKIGDARGKSISANNYGKYKKGLSQKEIIKLEKLTVEHLITYNYPFQISDKKNSNISKPLIIQWRLQDGFNLIKTATKQHGLRQGIINTLKAFRHR